MEDNRPLVSVNVLMYNSSRYIIETLESIKAQTYQNIELIMSDDKSTDNTVQICEDWISRNKNRFVSYKILVPEHNTGQSGNYNRAFRAATGEWIKEIDGDDLLLPNCISTLVDAAMANPDYKYFFGKVRCFGESSEIISLLEQTFDYSIFDKSPQEQLDVLYEKNCIPSPASFYSTKYIKELGYSHNELIPHLEDWPKWIDLINLGVRFRLINEFVVDYRVGSGISTKRRISPVYYRSNMLFNYYYLYPHYYQNNSLDKIRQFIDNETEIYRQLCFYQDLVAREHTSFLYKSIVMLQSPVRVIKRILYKMGKK